MAKPKWIIPIIHNLPQCIYIENQNGEYRHYECFHGMRELLEWLGYRIRTMQNIT